LKTPAFLGVGGAARNACAAICVDGQIVAACEQERLVRVRGVGLPSDGFPVEAVDEVLALSRCRAGDVASYVVAEPQVRFRATLPAAVVDHHHAHAATAFLTAPFDRAVVLVCDSHSSRELSVWIGDGNRLDDQRWPWRGPAFATLYADCAKLFDGRGNAHPHALELLAHLGRGDGAEKLGHVFRYADGGLEVDEDWQARVHTMIADERQRRGGPPADTASAVQRRVGQLLLDFLADMRASVDVDALCLAGGLFYNTYLNTLIRTSGLFQHVFVPANPGNAGLALGGALIEGRRSHAVRNATALSPFLGPEYDSEAIKSALDGCKLSYEFVREDEVLDAAVTALTRGQLVGWFQGRMEWGPRALGHRSILANPQSPHVLDNLNLFLRKRERSRPFGVSAREDALPAFFCGTGVSPFMEHQYHPRDDRLRYIMPDGATAIRVQTVGREMGLFHALHTRMEQATGCGVLVNTSFNGFHEPIVCSPRDAVRVFFGTGLDMLVIGRFILRK
jgi:carbamoyltransferase